LNFSRLATGPQPASLCKRITSAKAALEGWVQSPGHRRNILDANYDMSGIGVAAVGDKAYATQSYWGPAQADKVLALQYF
jgi:uncharacterized protein YkwD